MMETIWGIPDQPGDAEEGQLRADGEEVGGVDGEDDQCGGGQGVHA